jgi:hypothetical protein
MNLTKTKLLDQITQNLWTIPISFIKIRDLNESSFRLIVCSSFFKDMRLMKRLDFVFERLPIKILKKYTVIINPVTKEEYESEVK